MKRLFACMLIISILCCLAGCSTDTYSESSTLSKFKLKNVSSITLSGPSVDDSEGVTVDIYPDSNSASYNDLVQLVTGKKLDSCPTEAFGLCHITYNINTGETVKVYPANDGSNYVCLFSLNPSVGKYLELDQETMDIVVGILENNQIQVIYQ